ncbi:MAG TPA: DUF2254 domain-containing protein [Candidatus Acidoferrales bacterium]|nr:DUF2254 domain-containing protein [Candidatus Acidoferrales bacterium]
MAIHLRSSHIGAWLLPLSYAAVALILGFTVPRLAYTVFSGRVSTISVNAAIGIYSAVASGMIALTGIVFSLTFVMVQFSATAYSPRLVLWIARDWVVSHAIGVFTATFLYSLSALAWVDRGGSGRVPLVGVEMVAGLLIISVIMFVSLIQRITTLQVNRMLIFTADQGRRIVEQLYPPFDITLSASSDRIIPAACIQALVHHGPPRFIQNVHTSALVEVASKNGCVIEFNASVGDAVQDATPILRVLGTGRPLPEKSLRAAIELGDERTFEQDPKYAIRLLVDIAIRALSPAINDPTTAVQTLDHIEDLLLRLGRRRLELGAFFDEAGDLRLLIDFPTWDDFLHLALHEIRFYGATSIQVMRRMKAMVNELISVLPEERRPALRAWQQALQVSVERSFGDLDDKLAASVEDRQGLGTAARRRAG